MAITQKFKVEFMVTGVMPSDVEKDLADETVALAKRFMAGEELDHRTLHTLEIFVTEGMEGLMTFVFRDAMREGIRELRNKYADGDEYFKFSPASVRKVGA